MMSRVGSQGDFLLAGGVFGLLFIMIVPLPSVLLDMGLTTSIALALLLFHVTLSARKPLDVSIFPIALLVTTVFRLALNVASTRRILLEGHTGPQAAGRIIESFGQFVVGGNYVVGLVVFAILVIINFVVITKGAGRVAEVGARFTLDAMPGKQMAIDAELNAGLIDETTARRRREEVAREADFYGSMDGASKFVRGDAIAGIIITVVNIVGGAIIGSFQQGMPLAEAAKTYTILTIGDGLAGQVPALIVSTAAGLLVTRVSDADDNSLPNQIGSQLLKDPRVLAMVTLALLGFAMVPGLRVPFSLMAVLVGWFAWQVRGAAARDAVEQAPTIAARAEAKPEEMLRVEPLSVEVGMELLYLIDDRQEGELIARIQKTRSQFAKDLGLLLPAVHLKDNPELASGEYVIRLRGEELARGELHARKHLALDPGNASGKPRGIETIDPVFGLPAFWIQDGQLLKAQAMGYTIVDVPTVITTHFVELMHQHGHELYDAQQLMLTLERVQAANPKLVDDLIPDPIPRQVVLKIFRNLIREGLSTRDAQTILEAMADYAGKTTDPDVLTEFVRQRMARHVTRRFADPQGQIHYVAFGPKAEDAMLRGLKTNEGSPKLVLAPDVARRIFEQIQELTQTHAGNEPAVVLCPPLARGALRRMLERVLPRVTVLSSAELLPTVRLVPVGRIEL